MDVRQFVAENRKDWQRLEELLAEARRSGLASLAAQDLRSLGALHRKVSADLAACRTFHEGSKIESYLNDLALRSHNVVYRAPRRGALRRLADLSRLIPDAVARNGRSVVAAASIFALGILAGGVGTVLDESVAVLVLGGPFVERIQKGEFWIEKLFDVVPHSVASAGILTNNLSVAIALFAFGLTGALTALVLFMNGAMLGSVLVLCGRYGLLSRFVPFVVPHGVVEISAILLAGAGGLTVFDGWLSPGDGTRLEGLRRGARDGLRITLAAVPALLVAGPIEGLISPIESLPAPLRIALGVSLGLTFWGWIALGQRRPSRFSSR